MPNRHGSRLPMTRNILNSTSLQLEPKLIMISPRCPSYIYCNFTLDNSNLLLPLQVASSLYILLSVTRITANHVRQYATNQNNQCTAVQTIKLIWDKHVLKTSGASPLLLNCKNFLATGFFLPRARKMIESFGL